MKLEEKQLIKQLNQKISLISFFLDISAQILLAYSFASLSKGALHFDGPDQNQWPIKITQIMIIKWTNEFPPPPHPEHPFYSFNVLWSEYSGFTDPNLDHANGNFKEERVMQLVSSLPSVWEVLSLIPWCDHKSFFSPLSFPCSCTL